MHCFNEYAPNEKFSGNCDDFEVSYWIECPNKAQRSNKLLAHCQIDREYHVYNKFDSDFGGKPIESVSVLLLRTVHSPGFLKRTEHALHINFQGSFLNESFFYFDPRRK